jgi:glycosyltransferase involved in cell wall biosynthesis
MRLGIDIRVLMDKHYSGISEYLASLLDALLKKDATDDFLLFYNSGRDVSERMAAWKRSNTELRNPGVYNKFFNYVEQKIFGRPYIDRYLGGVDVFWQPHFNFCSLSPDSRKILTVHDLSFWRYPEFFSRRKNFWHHALNVKKQLANAQRLVAISENTKNDLIELAGVEPEKIEVIYSGLNFSPKSINEEEAVSFFTSQALPSQIPFILYLGNIEPRKNIAALIAAYNRFRDSGKAPRHLLVLAGAKGWNDRGIFRSWRDSAYRDDIIFLGYVSQSEKEILYSRAAIFAYPSFYEGFGFPPLEAMACGLPVVCSNVSSLPEVVGRGALTVDPFRPEEMAEAFSLISNDQKLREHLIEEGKKRVAAFSWEQAADKYLALFRDENNKKRK